MLPSKTARMRAELWSSLTAFTLAPFSISLRTIFSNPMDKLKNYGKCIFSNCQRDDVSIPLILASIKAVLWYPPITLISAFFSRSSSAILSCPTKIECSHLEKAYQIWIKIQYFFTFKNSYDQCCVVVCVDNIWVSFIFNKQLHHTLRSCNIFSVSDQLTLDIIKL